MCLGCRFLLYICVKGIDFCCIHVLGVLISLYICVRGDDFYCIYVLGVTIYIVYVSVV